MKSVEYTYSESCDLWIGAFRYYLGRATASTHSFCDSLMKHWETMPDAAKQIIKRDLQTALIWDDISLGRDYDVEKWKEVLSKITTRIERG